MIKRNLAGILVLAFALPSTSRAAEPGGDAPAFFVAPITTEVHREVVAADAAAYAVVDCTSLVVEGVFGLERLNPAEFERQLAALPVEKAAGLRLVVRYHLFGEPEIAGETKAAIRAALVQRAEAAGFDGIRVVETSTSAAWNEAIGRIVSYAEAAGAEEPIVDSEFVQAYPLRTRLSKLAVGDADSVVVIKRGFDGREQELSSVLRAAIKQAVASLNLAEPRGKLMYRVSSTTAGEPLIDKLFSHREAAPIPANAPPAIRAVMEQDAARITPSAGQLLAREMGFDSVTWSHSPNGGAPEKLIGQPAPNFELPGLDGAAIELTKFRAGRPALVTFWGVACGPCRVEAPHLTAVHRERGRELAILAVNGYDETAEVVAEYVAKAELSHPIVLNGREIAEKAYQVGAYPTTFWLDRDGVVIDYEVGFDSADVLARRVAAMLGE